MHVEQQPRQPPPHDGLDLLAAAELQDHLMVASNDLDRLQRLLEDASDALMSHFTGATQHLEDAHGQLKTAPSTLAQGAQAVLLARHTLGGAVTALQFQDMATQLIAHTTRRLRSCADRLARDAMGDDEDGDSVVEEAPLRPNPVTQDEMDAGSVELF